MREILINLLRILKQAYQLNEELLISLKCWGERGGAGGLKIFRLPLQSEKNIKNRQDEQKARKMEKLDTNKSKRLVMVFELEANSSSG